jgi:hypothetical protein
MQVVGRLVPPTDVDDRTWLLVLANAYANGFITQVSWDSLQGAVALRLIDEVYPDFESWLVDEDIDPADFGPGGV